MSNHNWEHDRQHGEHWLSFEPEPGKQRYMVVYKSQVDYVISCQLEDEPCGGDIRYARTLGQAKRIAEQLVDSGDWVELALED